MAGQIKACGNIPIENDEIREKLIEKFTVDIEVPSQPLTPTLGTRPSVPVEIEDDDSKLPCCVQLECCKIGDD